MKMLVELLVLPVILDTLVSVCMHKYYSYVYRTGVSVLFATHEYKLDADDC